MLTDSHVPDPVVTPVADVDPEQEALLGDSGWILMSSMTSSMESARDIADSFSSGPGWHHAQSSN